MQQLGRMVCVGRDRPRCGGTASDGPSRSGRRPDGGSVRREQQHTDDAVHQRADRDVFVDRDHARSKCAFRAGGTVTFLNNDSRPHAVSSDPITIHTDCPAINDVGTLNPGQSRSTGVLTIRRTCGFHDHTNETDTRWKGRIVVE